MTSDHVPFPKPLMSRETLFSAGRLALVALVLLSFLFLTYLISEDGDRQGASFYRAMAESPTTFSASPWGYRLLVPTIVYILPFPTMVTFSIITYSALVGAALIIWEFLRHLGFSMQSKIAGTSLVVFSFNTLHYTHNVAHVDPVTILLLCAALPAVYLNRRAWVVLLTVTLAFNREMAIFIPILYAAVWYGRVPTGWLTRYSLSLLAITLLVFAFLRSGIIFQSDSGMGDFDIGSNLSEIWRQHLGDPASTTFQIWWIFNFAWFVGFLGLLVTSSVFRRLSLLTVLAFTPPLVAFNLPRLVGLGIPGVVLFAAAGVERLHRGGGILDRSSVAALFLVISNALVLVLGTRDLAVKPASLLLYVGLVGVALVIWWPIVRMPVSRINGLRRFLSRDRLLSYEGRAEPLVR